jgi:hypothetical protein
MAKAKSLVGLDVHAAKIVAVVLDVESGELRTFRMNGDAGEAAGFCAGLLAVEPGRRRQTCGRSPTRLCEPTPLGIKAMAAEPEPRRR